MRAAHVKCQGEVLTQSLDRRTEQAHFVGRGIEVEPGVPSMMLEPRCAVVR
jgi:hypothetical protein